MILLSELSRRRIRSVNKLIRVGKLEVSYDETKYFRSAEIFKSCGQNLLKIPNSLFETLQITTVQVAMVVRVDEQKGFVLCVFPSLLLFARYRLVVAFSPNRAILPPLKKATLIFPSAASPPRTL